MTSDGETGDLIATLRIPGHSSHLMRGPVTIGRDPRADGGATIEVDGDPLVSKSHLCIDIDQGDLIVTDLGSSNGTYLHHAAGETAVPSDRWIPLPDGAEIEFGDQRMIVERPTSDEASDLAVERANASTIEHTQIPAPAAEVPPRNAAVDDRGESLSGPAAESADAQPTEAGISCSRCHRDLPPGSKFCDGCGAPIMMDAEPVPAADDPGNTVVISPGGFAPNTPPRPSTPAGPAPATSVQPTALHGAPPPQYGGVQSTPAPQGPPPAQYGQASPVQIPHESSGLVFVDPTAASASAGNGKKILLAVATIVVVGLIGFALVSVLGGDDSTASGRGTLRTIATSVDELWSTDVNGVAGFPGLGETAVYVAAGVEDDIVFTSLRRDDGDENWDTTIDDVDFGAVVGEFDETTVVVACAFDAEANCQLVGLDLADGGEAWREPIGDGFAFTSDGAVVADDGEGLIRLDPNTGDRLERVRGEPSFDDFNALLVDDEGEVSAYDNELLPLFDPVRVDDEATAVTFDGERLVVALGDEIEYIDGAGDASSGPFVDGDVTRLVAIDSSTLVAELGDEVVVYDIDGDDAVERWSENGTLDEVVAPDGGTVVIIDDGTQRLIIDLATGSERFDVDGDATSILTLVTANAFVVTERTDQQDREGDATVTAYDWTSGDEIWTHDVVGEVRIDEVVIVVETDGDVTVLG